jgi:two-component system sensor histidine kinase/response regulator
VNQRIAVKMLEKMGCRVDVAVNGQRALDALDAMPYDLVLMDCQMPEMDGFDATRAVRAREGDGRRTPIVAMSANAMAGDRERCLEAGMDGYLTKPVRPDELAATISQWLPRVEFLDVATGPALIATDPATDAATDGPPNPPGFGLDLTLLGRAQLAELRAVGGTDGDRFVADLVDLFLAEGERGLDQIRDGVENANPGAVMNAAHRLKGSALNLGCTSLAEAAELLETLGRGGALDGAGPLLERLAGAYDRTAAVLLIEVEAA